MSTVHNADSHLTLLRHEEVGPAKGVGDLPPPRTRRAERDNSTAKWQLVVAGILCLVFMAAEVVGGYFAGSLAIMTDAAHLLSDVAGFLISLFAIWLAERPPTSQATWGFHRVEVIGALASVLLIWLLTGVLVYEAILRIISPEPVDGKIMFITAAGGLAVNLAMMRVLHQGGSHHGHSHGGGGDHGHSHGHSHASSENASAKAAQSEANINVRAAFIHVLGDLLQSIGVMIAAAIVWAKPEWHIVDPAITFVFALLVLATTFGIMKSGLATLLNAVPPGIDVSALVRELSTLPGVANVHDVHVWGFGSGSRVALSVHLVADDQSAAVRAALRVASAHGIGHTTVQVERCGTSDVTACFDANEHIDACAISVAGGSHDGIRSIVVERPPANTRHNSTGGGCGGLLAPQYDRAHVHHGGSFGSCDGGSGGGGHGHSHGGVTGSSGHGHAHGGAFGGGSGHGHAHGGVTVASTSASAPVIPKGRGFARPAGSTAVAPVTSDAVKAAGGQHGHSHDHGSHGHSHA